MTYKHFCFFFSEREIKSHDKSGIIDKFYAIKNRSYETQAPDELTADDYSSCLYDVCALILWVLGSVYANGWQGAALKNVYATTSCHHWMGSSL